MCVQALINVKIGEKKEGAVLIVDTGSSVQEFMCNAQVKRMSKRKKIIQKAGYRVRFEG